MESGFIIALLRNNTITIHSLENLDRPAQVIPVDPSIEAFGLSYSPYGITIRDVVRDERMTKVPFTLLSGKLESSSPLPSWGIPVAMEEPEDVSLEDDPPSGSGLTPPSSPPTFQKQPIKAPSGSSLLSAQQSSRAPFSSAIAETLLIGRHKIQGLTPTPTIIRLERLCAEHKMDEAADLVDEERRRGRRGAIEGDKVSLSNPLYNILTPEHPQRHDAPPPPLPRLPHAPRHGV